MDLINRSAFSSTDDTACTMEYVASFFDSTQVTIVAVPLAIWIFTVHLGTVVQSQSGLSVLSLSKSIQELTVARVSRLNVLDVFRVFGIAWVMMNHTGSEGRIDILERNPSAETFKRAVHEHPIFGAFLGNSALGVEIFLVLSGLLAARTWQREAHKPFWSHYAKYITRRVVRLFPSVAFFVYLAAGPIMQNLLPRFHTSMISTCGFKGIGAHLAFLSNWQETPTCLGYLWYVGLDMQLHLVAPFIFHALNKWPQTALSAIVAVIGASTALRAKTCMDYDICNKSDVDIPFISYPNVDPETVKHVYEGLWEMYARPCTKIGPFIIGLTYGYFSLTWEKTVRLSNKASSILFSAGLILAIAIIFAILPEYWWPDMPSNLYNITYTATFRSIFAVSLITMIAAATLREEMIRIPVYWSVLAKLTFSAYLLHMPVVYVFNYMEYLQKAEGAIALLVVLPLVFSLSFICAVPFHLFVEAPFNRVVTMWEKQMGEEHIPPVNQPQNNERRSVNINNS